MSHHETSEDNYLLLERFDKAAQFIAQLSLVKDKAWQPVPDERLYLYLPRQGSPYSPSIFYEPERAYVRRAHLKDPVDKNFIKAQESLEQIEQKVIQLQSGGAEISESAE